MDVPIGSGRVLTAFIAAAAALLAGCSAGTPSAGPTGNGTPQAGPQAHVTSSPVARPSPVAQAAACKLGDLSVLLGNARKVAGAVTYPIRFQNISATPCTVYGFPDVSFTGANQATQVGPAASRNTTSPEHLVTVQPQGSAAAIISVVNATKYPSGCRQARVSGIVVDLPGQTNRVHLSFSGLTCVNPKFRVLTVNAMAAGQLAVGD